MEDEPDVPETLGGYQIERKLGQGGMGSVYLARQLSLDRFVAVKVLNQRLSRDAGFVARFTREAYAAAQLTHHNVVQIYDIGEDRGRHFYSMEFVEGDTLGGLVAKDGKLDPEVAVGYALQAARGLKFAHDQGLVHRDVKPDNLMVNDQGIVKVADLGLVKKRGASEIKHSFPTQGPGSKLAQAQSANTTGFDMSMGTPAYMAPEQARDATRVDGRADIYSLGCTLYDLLTGHPPFHGKTAMEVLTKHATELVTPPDLVSKRVPKELSAVLMKMVAKKPDDRYASIGDCVRAMEDFLGVGGTGPFTPKEEHAAAMEQAAKAFNDAPLARARRYGVILFFIACLIAAISTALFGSTLGTRILWSGACVGLAVLTSINYLILAGVTQRHVVFLKLRQLAFGARIGAWIKTLLGIGIVGLLLYVLNLLWVWAIIAVVSFGLAAILHFAIEAMRDRKRKTQVEPIEAMLRTMRLRGLDEDSVRQFACRYAGRSWEEFYETLFGYDAKLEARRRWGIGLRGKPRPKFAAWRDFIIARIDAHIARRKASRERRLLAKLEEKRLNAEGMSQQQAKETARKETQALIDQANRVRQASAVRTRDDVTAGPVSGIGGIKVITPAVVDDLEPGERVHESWIQRRHGGVIGLLLGPRVRFPIALLLLVTFSLWFHSVNPDFPRNLGKVMQDTVNQAHDNLSGEAARRVALVRPTVEEKHPTHHGVNLFYIPSSLQPKLNGYAIGLAGLLLLISCFFTAWKPGLFSLIAAAVILIAGQWFPG